MKSLHNKWMLLPLSLCLLLVFSFCSNNDALASNEDNSDNGYYDQLMAMLNKRR